MKIKGGVLFSRVAFVREHFGDQGWQDVLAALSPEPREVLSGLVLPSSWYPFEISQQLDDTIVRVLGKGRPGVFEKIGAASAQKNLTSSHRHFLAPGRPQDFLESAPALYGFYYDTGRRQYERTGPTSGTLTTYDAETFSAPDCLTVIGWYKHALEMCGARCVSISEDSCRAHGAPFCRYTISWESVATDSSS